MSMARMRGALDRARARASSSSPDVRPHAHKTSHNPMRGDIPLRLAETLSRSLIIFTIDLPTSGPPLPPPLISSAHFVFCPNVARMPPPSPRGLPAAGVGSISSALFLLQCRRLSKTVSGRQHAPGVRAFSLLPPSLLIWRANTSGSHNGWIRDGEPSDSPRSRRPVSFLVVMRSQFDVLCASMRRVHPLLMLFVMYAFVCGCRSCVGACLYVCACLLLRPGGPVRWVRFPSVTRQKPPRPAASILNGLL